MISEIIAGTFLNVVLGMIWYGPLFGDKWMKAAGVKNPIQKPKDYAGTLLVAIIAATVTSFVIGLANYRTFADGFKIGLILAVGFTLPSIGNTIIWQRKRRVLLFLDGGFYLLLFALMGGTFAVM